MYDEFGFPEEFTYPDELAESTEIYDTEPSDEDQPSASHIPIRKEFPALGSSYMGGQSDGWEYRVAFGGSKLGYSYEMLKQFLKEEGYHDIPLPETADDLKLFKRPRPGQLQLFGENGYIHNPIKILFSKDPKQRNTLTLCICNEKHPGHLLRFHGLSKDK